MCPTKRSTTPDRMVFEDLDIANLDVVNAYLDHPVTNALIEDEGRAFRRTPSAEQRSVIERELTKGQLRRVDVVEALQAPGLTDEQRAALQQLLEVVDRIIDAARLRLLELDDER